MTAILSITRDPFRSWKTTERLLTEAKERGFPVHVVLDENSVDVPRDRARLIALGAAVSTFRSRGFCESALESAEIADPWTLWVSDDEMPSRGLWRFAASPPAKRVFRIQLVPVLPDGALYRAQMDVQPRLFPTGSLHVREDRFEGGLRLDAPEYFAPQLVLWHYAAWAPRAEREAKVARYVEMERARGLPGYADLTHALYLWEDHPELRIRSDPDLAKQLP